MIEILLLLVLVWIYLGVIGSCTFAYEDYLKKGSKKFFALVLFLDSIEVYLLSRSQLEALSRSLEIIYVSSAVFITILVIQYAYDKRISRCSRIEFRSVDGMEFYVCHGGPVGAWYNPRKGIYISDRLLEVLNRKELKAVYYHEKGHEKNVRIDNLSKAIAVGIWSFFFSAVFSVVIFLFFYPVVFSAEILIFLLSLFITACSLVAVCMLYPWFSEHEADIHSIKELGTAEPLVSALMKIHFYARLQRECVLLNRRIPSSPLTKPRFQNPGKKRIFRLILIESLKTASNVLDLLSIVKDPLPPTHPPLWLRIYKILRESKNTQN
jgi:Zn-dependent protease with chaperone function